MGGSSGVAVPPPPPPPPPPPGLWRRLGPWRRVAGAGLLFVAGGGALAAAALALPARAGAGAAPLAFPHSLEDLRRVVGALRSYEHDHAARVTALFAAGFLYKQAFAIPGTFLLNMLGGALSVGWGGVQREGRGRRDRSRVVRSDRPPRAAGTGFGRDCRCCASSRPWARPWPTRWPRLRARLSSSTILPARCRIKTGPRSLWGA
jgi:hypothetical protein